MHEYLYLRANTNGDDCSDTMPSYEHMFPLKKSSDSW